MSSTIGKPAEHYIDARAFTSCFRHRHKNHNQICEGLNLIVQRVARCFWFAFSQDNDRDDAIANTVLFCIERICKFDRSKGSDAFTYFTSVAANCLRRQMTMLSQDRKEACNFSDLGTSDSVRFAMPGSDYFVKMKPYTQAV